MSSSEALPAGIAAEATPCLTAKCIDCDEAFDDEFTRHFSTLDELLREVTALMWTVFPDGLVCETCTGTRACTAAGAHVWRSVGTISAVAFWSCDRCGEITRSDPEASR